MRHFILALALAASPLAAQEAPQQDGSSLMEQGARLFLKGLMSEMEPTLNDMQGALDQIGPKLAELRPQIDRLISMVDDVRNYHMPEKLPNGDIIIRRKTPEELEKEKAAPVGPPEIEL